MDWFQIQPQMASNRSIWPVGVHRTHPNRFGACGAPSWVCAGLRLVIWCGGGLTGTGTREQTKRRRFLLCRLVVAGQRHGYTNQLHGRSMCQNVGPTSHDGTDKPKGTKMTSFGMAPNVRRARDWKARSRHVDNGTCVSEDYSDRGAIDKRHMFKFTGF